MKDDLPEKIDPSFWPTSKKELAAFCLAIEYRVPDRNTRFQDFGPFDFDKVVPEDEIADAVLATIKHMIKDGWRDK